jgi:4-carboxymuconolactone decarboxylase
MWPTTAGLAFRVAQVKYTGGDAVSDDLYETGERIRRRVLGDAHVDRSNQSRDDFNSDYQRFMTEYCWGAIWSRDGLSLRQRSLNNLCILAALNRPHEFEIHFRGALRNGCTKTELRETLLQIAVYAGIPAAGEAFRIATKVLAEEGPPPSP